MHCNEAGLLNGGKHGNLKPSFGYHGRYSSARCAGLRLGAWVSLSLEKVEKNIYYKRNTTAQA